MAALNVFVHMVDNKEIEYLKQRFVALDLNNTGFLNSDALKEALSKSNLNFDDEKLSQIL